MKTTFPKERVLKGFWFIAAVALIWAVMFLFTERLFWKMELRSAASDEGRLEAREDFQHERFQYLIADPNGYFNFTGELKDGIEIWNHAYAESFPVGTPFRVHAESYILAYNGNMERYVRGLDAPPSAVEHRSAELRHEDYKVRERAAKFLGMMGPQARDAVPPLIVATQDDYAEVRARAVWALGRIGPSDHSEEATRALELVRERLDQKTQELISRALREISARNVEPRETVSE